MRVAIKGEESDQSVPHSSPQTITPAGVPVPKSNAERNFMGEMSAQSSQSDAGAESHPEGNNAGAPPYHTDRFVQGQSGSDSSDCGSPTGHPR